MDRSGLLKSLVGMPMAYALGSELIPDAGVLAVENNNGIFVPRDSTPTVEPVYLQRMDSKASLYVNLFESIAIPPDQTAWIKLDRLAEIMTMSVYVVDDKATLSVKGLMHA